MKEEKVYITRDEGSNEIWIWRNPKKGNWSPRKLEDSDIVNWVRLENMDELDKVICYSVKEFKKQFGFTINRKQKKCVLLDKEKLEKRKNCLYYPEKGIKNASKRESSTENSNKSKKGRNSRSILKKDISSSN